MFLGFSSQLDEVGHRDEPGQDYKMKRNLPKFLVILAGISFINFGYGLIQTPYVGRTITGYIIDTSDYSIPLGIFIIALGGVLVVWAVRAIQKARNKIDMD